MKANATALEGVLLLEPRVFSDCRGFVLESYNENVLRDLGIVATFVQDNHSYSLKGVLRGLHYQILHPQGKLIRVVTGEILDVAVDLRMSSPTFGRWHTEVLSSKNFRLLWVPPGCAHGFHVLSDGAHVLYKATDFYHPEGERTIAWNDPDLDIDWQLQCEPKISMKDAGGLRFRDAAKFE
jgi:dTDP-4-dehydrorhamnose 3,5-epimerase